MKRGLCILVLVFGMCRWVHAQFFNSFLDQESTHIKNLEDQIAETQLYLSDLEKGYSLIENGLSTIRSITGGDFNLHNTFFSSLKSISPSVADMAEIGEIMAIQVSIMEQCSKTLQIYKSSAYLHTDEVSMISQVYSTVLQVGLDDINALISLTTASSLSLTDDQRMNRIDALDTDMHKQSAFIQEFTGLADLLCQERINAQGEVDGMKALYGLP
jgi:hypothetical protein